MISEICLRFAVVMGLVTCTVAMMLGLLAFITFDFTSVVDLLRDPDTALMILRAIILASVGVTALLFALEDTDK
jgi:hypothetical protein